MLDAKKNLTLLYQTGFTVLPLRLLDDFTGNFVAIATEIFLITDDAFRPDPNRLLAHPGRVHGIFGATLTVKKKPILSGFKKEPREG